MPGNSNNLLDLLPLCLEGQGDCASRLGMKITRVTIWIGGGMNLPPESAPGKHQATSFVGIRV